jgi:hypothetical protein
MTHRLLILLTVFLITNGIGQTLIKGIDLKTIPSNWIEVEQRKGRWVRYQPCDASIFTLDLTEKKITTKWGQSVEVYIISESKRNRDSSMTILARAGDQNCSFNFKIKSHRTLWTIKFTDGAYHRKYLIPVQDTAKYSVIVQPCEDCWDKEDCNGRKKNNEH